VLVNLSGRGDKDLGSIREFAEVGVNPPARTPRARR
jgi:tryptophan synthase beta subunit